MQKTFKYFIAFNLASIMAISTVNAECSYTDKATLNKIAANVKTNYEILTENRDIPQTEETKNIENKTERIDYANLNIANISREINVEQTDEQTGEIKVFTLGDATSGLVSQRIDDLSFVRKYSFKIVGSEESTCPNELLKTIRVTVPRFNEYSMRDICTESPDFYLCKEYVTFDEISDKDFINKVNYYKIGKVNEEGLNVLKKDSTIDKILKAIINGKYYIAGAAVIIIGGIVIIRRNKTKKQRELGL